MRHMLKFKTLHTRLALSGASYTRHPGALEFDDSA